MTAGFGLLHPVSQHHIANTLGWRDLRALQQDSIQPVLAGNDALLIAPTAGGKTEAAMFPLLTRMADQGWMDVSVLYLCPLKALLNNLEPRISTYTSWMGRDAAIWHGDVDSVGRRQIKLARPDVLLTVVSVPWRRVGQIDIRGLVTAGRAFRLEASAAVVRLLPQ